MTNCWSYRGEVSEVLEFVRTLTGSEIAHRLSIVRADGLMIEVSVPGERWEIDFMSNGTVEVERFVSDGTIGDEALLTDLFRRFSG